MEERGNLPGFCACAGKSAAECLGIKFYGAPEGKAQSMSTSIGREKWEDPLTTLKRRTALITGLKSAVCICESPGFAGGLGHGQSPQTQKFLLFKLNRQELLLPSSASTANFRHLRLCKLPHLQSCFLVLQAFSAPDKALNAISETD